MHFANYEKDSYLAEAACLSWSISRSVFEQTDVQPFIPAQGGKVLRLLPCWKHSCNCCPPTSQYHCPRPSFSAMIIFFNAI